MTETEARAAMDNELKAAFRRHPDWDFPTAWNHCCALPELASAVRAMGGTPPAVCNEPITTATFKNKVRDMEADGMTRKEAFETAMWLPEMNPGVQLTAQHHNAALFARAKKIQASNGCTFSQAYSRAQQEPDSRAAVSPHGAPVAS